ncbi:MAG: hypothetical protein WCW40_07220 [Bacteroidota bacterium]
MTDQRFFSGEHHLNDYGVSLYVDAVLLDRTGELPPEITDHVEQCTACAAHVLEMCEIMQDVRLDRSVKHPFLDAAVKKPQRIVTMYRIAAVFLVGIFGGVLYYSLSDHKNNIAPDVAQHSLSVDSTTGDKTTTAPTSTGDQFAANFTPSPNLDDLVQNEFRSESITIISPEIGATVSSPITFRWKSYDGPVKIKILSNKEVTLLTSIVEANSFVTPKPFAPGLYYWKLEANDELLFVGKFFIK